MSRPTNHTLAHEAQLAEHGVKTCRSCRQVFPLSDFGKRAQSRDGLQAYCKPCVNMRNVKYAANASPEQKAKRASRNRRYKLTPETKRQMRGYSVKRNYGLELEEYEELLSRGCSICDDPATHMDHDHATGKLRGPLCQRCNLGIGLFLDDPTRLAAAMIYLLR